MVLDGTQIGNDIVFEGGNDSMNWVSGQVAGGIYMDQKPGLTGNGTDGTDKLTISSPNYDGSQILDGGDDVLASDALVDELVLNAVTVTTDGAQIKNWEKIILKTNTRLTLTGSTLLTGKGIDTAGMPLGLAIESGAALGFKANAFTIDGDLRNAGEMNLRGSAPGQIITITGDYKGNDGKLLFNTKLGECRIRSSQNFNNFDAIHGLSP